jgi:hypothetical protein
MAHVVRRGVGRHVSTRPHRFVEVIRERHDRRPKLRRKHARCSTIVAAIVIALSSSSGGPSTTPGVVVVPVGNGDSLYVEPLIGVAQASDFGDILVDPCMNSSPACSPPAAYTNFNVSMFAQ